MGQALTLAAKIGDTRWLLAQQSRQGNSKGVPWSSGFLADPAVRQFWPVRRRNFRIRFAKPWQSPR
jgi:hypothetical protein